VGVVVRLGLGEVEDLYLEELEEHRDQVEPVRCHEQEGVERYLWLAEAVHFHKPVAVVHCSLAVVGYCP